MTKLNGNLRMGKSSEPRAICVHNAHRFANQTQTTFQDDLDLLRFKRVRECSHMGQKARKKCSDP